MSASAESGSPSAREVSECSPRLSPVEQALQAAIKQLDLKAQHLDPKPWAEVWLTFPDRTGNCMGLGGGLDGERGSTGTGEKGSWQEGALRRLRELLAQGSGEGVALGGKGEGADLGEHLQMAAHAMERVMHAVAVLQAPEQHARPLVLKDYTGELVGAVCADLRQWLEKLADVLPVYHVHILESETERRRLLALSERLMKELEAERRLHKRETIRADETKRQIEELKMKQRAQALLGVQDDDDDALVYSRNDVKRMKDEWSEELLREYQIKQLQPLLDEIANLRRQKDELQDRLTAQSGKHVPQEKPGTHEGLLESLKTLTERCAKFSPFEKALSALEQAAKDPDTANFAEVTENINRLPELGAVPRVSTAPKELVALEAELRSCPADSGAERLLSLVSWACSALPGGTGAAPGEPPPRWDVDCLKGEGRPAGRDFGMNTEENFRAAVAADKPVSDGKSDVDMDALMKKLREEMEAKYRDQMNRMKAEFERQLQAERDAAAAERARFEALVAELEADLKAANKRAKDLRQKLLDLQRMMKAKGMGGAFDEALQGSGVGEYLVAGGVFERLYSDALARMRRWQEAYNGRTDTFTAKAALPTTEMDLYLRRTPPIITGFSALKHVLQHHVESQAAEPVPTVSPPPKMCGPPNMLRTPPKQQKQQHVSNLLPPMVKALMPEDPLSLFVRTPGVSPRRVGDRPGGGGLHIRARDSDQESDASPGGRGSLGGRTPGGSAMDYTRLPGGAVEKSLAVEKLRTPRLLRGRKGSVSMPHLAASAAMRNLLS